MISYHEFNKDYDYIMFDRACTMIIQNPNAINEGFLDSLSKNIKDKIDTIKELATGMKIELSALLKVFKLKAVYTAFMKFKFTPSNIIKVVKSGYKAWKELHNIIAKYIADTGIVKFTDKKIKDLDVFLSKHPKVKGIAGLAVAGFLIYQWTQLVSFTGDIEFDFDQSTLFSAIKGEFTLSDILTGPDGIHMIMFIVTGVLTGASFPWPGNTWILFSASIVYTLSKDKYPLVAKNIIKHAKSMYKLKV